MYLIFCWWTEAMKAMVLLAEVEKGQVLQLQLHPPIAPPPTLLPVLFPKSLCRRWGELQMTFFREKAEIFWKSSLTNSLSPFKRQLMMVQTSVLKGVGLSKWSAVDFSGRFSKTRLSCRVVSYLLKNITQCFMHLWPTTEKKQNRKKHLLSSTRSLKEAERERVLVNKHSTTGRQSSKRWVSRAEAKSVQHSMLGLGQRPWENLRENLWAPVRHQETLRYPERSSDTLGDPCGPWETLVVTCIDWLALRNRLRPCVKLWVPGRDLGKVRPSGHIWLAAFFCLARVKQVINPPPDVTLPAR